MRVAAPKLSLRCAAALLPHRSPNAVAPRRGVCAFGHVLRLLAALLLVVPAGVAADPAPVEVANTPDTAVTAWLHGEQLQRLDAELVRYELIRDTGGWPALPDDALLAPGVRDVRVPLLRRRLQASGDLTGEMGADRLRFDAALRAALQSFQRRHGLEPVGRVDRATLEQLNVSVDARLAQLAAARAAWAKLPAPSEQRRVWVNVPEAEVAALANRQLELRLRAVVGHPSRPTPTLSSAIRRVIVNPTWTVPLRIAAEDLLPRQLANPDYLSANGFRVSRWSQPEVELDPARIDWQGINPQRFPYRLRQDPGPGNSLGRYKFEFVNDYDVYLHDTPTAFLLDLSVRWLSSGCVRVAEAEQLARWLAARSPGPLVPPAPNDYATRAVSLVEPVPIDIVYLSAWVAPASGAVNFRRDVYAQTAGTRRAASAN